VSINKLQHLQDQPSSSAKQDRSQNRDGVNREPLERGFDSHGSLSRDWSARTREVSEEFIGALQPLHVTRFCSGSAAALIPHLGPTPLKSVKQLSPVFSRLFLLATITIRFLQNRFSAAGICSVTKISKPPFQRDDPLILNFARVVLLRRRTLLSVARRPIVDICVELTE
jgi:hypothetical protein